VDPGAQAQETADRFAKIVPALDDVNASPGAEIAIVLREALALACYQLDRAASAWAAGAADEARLSVAALAGCDLLARRIVHRLAHALGESRMPDYIGAMTGAEMVRDHVQEIASVFDVDLGDAQGPETIASRNTIEDMADVLLPLLSDEHSDARLLAIVAASIGALRHDISPSAWLAELSEELPAERNEPRDIGFLSQNPEAVVTIMRSTTRLRRAHALDANRETLPKRERHPYAELFDFPGEG
jgi:hypothetical protein